MFNFPGFPSAYLCAQGPFVLYTEGAVCRLWAVLTLLFLSQSECIFPRQAAATFSGLVEGHCSSASPFLRILTANSLLPENSRRTFHSKSVAEEVTPTSGRFSQSNFPFKPKNSVDHLLEDTHSTFGQVREDLCLCSSVSLK